MVLKFLSNGDGAPPCEKKESVPLRRSRFKSSVYDARKIPSERLEFHYHLLHVTEDVLPAVKHSLPLLGVQLVDEVSGEVFVAVLVSKTCPERSNMSAEGLRCIIYKAPLRPP